MTTKALIFDMDGTLIDSEKYWKEVDYEILHPFFDDNPEVDFDEINEQITGTGMSGTYKIFKAAYGFDYSEEEYIKKRSELALEKIYSRAELSPGVEEFIHTNLAKYKMAIGTSSPPPFLEKVFTNHPVLRNINTIVTPQDVGNRSKPDPAIFLKCAELLGVLPSECIVFEDSTNGIAAGKAAGMQVYGFRTDVNQQQDFSKTDRVFTDFSQLEL
jgi:HAD superfamily hydrolase (TIGR01509 family)